MTPTDHAAMMRFTYPGDDASVALRQRHRPGGGLTLDTGDGTFTGFSDVQAAACPRAPPGCSSTASSTRRSPRRQLTGGGGDDVTGYLRFDAGQRPHGHPAPRHLPDQRRPGQGTTCAGRSRRGRPSRRSSDRAQHAVGRPARARSRSRAPTPDQLTTLYSSLYRLYLYPNSGFEKVGSASYQYASPFSKQTGDRTPRRTPAAKIVDGKVYVNNGFWDTYRTTWPAYSLPHAPARRARLVDGFVQQYKDGGWISRWSSPGYADLMTGTSSDVAFADAYVKGVKFDAEAAYEAAVKNATVVPPSSGVGRKGMDDLALPRLHRAPPPTRACRGRWRATSTTTASPRWARRSTRRPSGSATRRSRSTSWTGPATT